MLIFPARQMETAMSASMSDIARSIKILSVASFLTLFSNSLYAECRDILEQGIRNTYQGLRTSSLRSSFYDGFCNHTIQKATNSSGGGLSIAFPVDGVPIDLGGSYDESSGNSFQQDLCGNREGGLNDAKYEKLLQAVADPAIVQAWSQCENNAGGVLITGKLNGSRLILSLRFRNVGNISSTELVGDADFDGVICPTQWVDGMSLDGSTKFMQCDRIGEKPVTVTVNTKFNGAMFYIPEPPKLTFTSDTTNIPAPDNGPRTVTAKVCIDPGNDSNRCPAPNPLAADGTQCSCRPPVAIYAFDNGYVRTIQIAGVIPAPGTGVLPAPGTGVLPAPGTGAIPVPQ